MTPSPPGSFWGGTPDRYGGASRQDARHGGRAPVPGSSLPARVDVLVVGAGIIGAAVAGRLAAAGLDVLPP